jgi:hypothetical protein
MSGRTSASHAAQFLQLAAQLVERLDVGAGDLTFRVQRLEDRDRLAVILFGHRAIARPRQLHQGVAAFERRSATQAA